MTKRKLVLISGFVITLFLGILLLSAQQITPPPHFDDLDSGSGLDALYAIGLASLVLFLAAGLGQQIIKPFKLKNWTFIERAVISLPLGLAVLGYCEFFMGLIGWIKPIHQIALLFIVSIISIKESTLFFSEAIVNLKYFKNTWLSFSLMMKVIFTAGVLALVLAFMVTLTPPFDYDSLMYHLQGPRLFLEAGKIIPIPENWFTFYPSTWGMIYMLGMGLGSDIFARLIHFSTLLLFIFATYAFGKRFLPPPGGWMAAAILLGMPQLLIWGGFAYIDMAWGLFQYLAVAFLLVWTQEKDHKLLILSGIMQGLALGSKYLAFSGVAILGLCILWLSYRAKPSISDSKNTIINALAFGIIAVLVASPWYLKNFIWTGNPVFPMYLPQQIINPAELNLTREYLTSFGTGRRWYDFIMLPVNIYLHYPKYGTFIRQTDFPNPLFLLIFAYPWTRKWIRNQNKSIIDILFVLTVLQFITWAMGSQQIRFLMPLFPGLSILASAVLLRLPNTAKKIRWDWVIKTGAIGGMVIISLVLLMRYFAIVRPYYVVFGTKTKSEFLTSILFDYSGINYINTQLPKEATVFIPWYGKGYYCDQRCYPDIGQAKWSTVVQQTNKLSEISEWLIKNEFTHILLSWEDITFFITEHDPRNIHGDAAALLINEFLPLYAKKIYEDDRVQLFQISTENNFSH